MENNGKSDALQEAKYDVFISHSSKDYLDEKTGQPRKDSPVTKLLECLDEQKIRYWIYTENAGTQISRKVLKAIGESKMMVFVSSKASNESIWVAGEVQEALRIAMPIIPLRIDDTLYSEDFRLLLSPSLHNHIDCFSDPNAFNKLLREINDKKDDYIKKQKAVQNGLIQEQIESDKEKYYELFDKLRRKSDRIIRKLSSIGKKHKTCPVCGAIVPISDTFCDDCGWMFVPPFETSEAAVDEKHLSKAQEVWRRAESGVWAAKEISSLKEEIARDREQKYKYDEELASANKQMEQDKAQIKSLMEERDALHKDIEAAKVKINPFSGHDYVDLGLPSGILWATCNVGASKPSDYGDYFAWGETKSKGESGRYYWQNLKHLTVGDSYKNVRFSKYVTEARYGTVDNRNILEQSDDVSHTQWGGIWRMPTVDNWVELHKNCDWKWTKQDGRNGYRVTSKKNGASIFLPAAGWRDGEAWILDGENGNYWSSSLSSDYSYAAFRCFFYSGVVYPSNWNYRCYGLSVRPVASSLQ